MILIALIKSRRFCIDCGLFGKIFARVIIILNYIYNQMLVYRDLLVLAILDIQVEG